jgi:hypothetical protein
MRRRDRYEMIATPLLYLQHKSELASMNTFGSVGVRVYVLLRRHTKTENNNLKQRYAIKFCVKLREGATDTYEKFPKAFGNSIGF